MEQIIIFSLFLIYIIFFYNIERNKLKNKILNKIIDSKKLVLHNSKYLYIINFSIENDQNVFSYNMENKTLKIQSLNDDIKLSFFANFLLSKTLSSLYKKQLCDYEAKINEFKESYNNNLKQIIGEEK